VGFNVGTRKAILALLLIFWLVLPITSVFGTEEDSWTTLEPMPTSRSWIGVAVVDGKIYAMVDEINYEYDPATNSWTTKTPMPNPRNSFGIAVVDNKIYCIGGTIDDYTYTNLNQVYDPLTDTWETKKSMPTSRYALDANVVNGKIYMIGGSQRTPNDNLDINEVYDPVTDTWTTKTSIPTGVDYYSSAVFDNKIYIIGGAVGVALNQIYDPETDTWSSGAPLPTGVDSAAAGVTTGIFAPKRIYVIGGKQNLDAVKLNQVYDPETDTWVYRWAMPTARYGLGVAIINDTIYAIGGREGWVGFPVSAANEKYTPAGYIPEFSSWIILVAGLSIVLVLSIIYRTRFSGKRK
jgi:N-acetylneuraminic acid mutarotase